MAAGFAGSRRHAAAESGSAPAGAFHALTGIKTQQHKTPHLFPAASPEEGQEQGK